MFFSDRLIRSDRSGSIQAHERRFEVQPTLLVEDAFNPPCASSERPKQNTSLPGNKGYFGFWSRSRSEPPGQLGSSESRLVSGKICVIRDLRKNVKLFGRQLSRTRQRKGQKAKAAAQRAQDRALRGSAHFAARLI